jgi:hypothetical protein
MTYGPPIAERCDIPSHGWCNRVMIEQERLIVGDVIHEGWWHLQSTGPDTWRMWDHERKRKAGYRRVLDRDAESRQA